MGRKIEKKRLQNEVSTKGLTMKERSNLLYGVSSIWLTPILIRLLYFPLMMV